MYKAILLSHITFGFIAMLTGFLAMIFKKGQVSHKRSGLVYFVAMCYICLSAIVMSFLKLNLFLLSIAIFSFYLSFTGYRHTKRKDGQFHPIDIIMLMLTGLVGIGMIIYATILFGLAQGDDAFVLLVFGGTSLFMVIQDLLQWKKVIVRQHWLSGHVARIGGSYIATITAFATTNLHYWPQIYNWLLPSVIGSLLITRASLLVKKTVKMR